MTDIQASVIVTDKVASSIETKIKAIGRASENASVRVERLNSSIGSLKSANVVRIQNAFTNLSRINISNLANSMAQIKTHTDGVSSKLIQSEIASVKLQLAQTQLAIAQAKLAQQQQRVATTANLASVATQRLAQATANADNAKSRARVASERYKQSLTRTEIATIRLVTAKQRLQNQIALNQRRMSGGMGEIRTMINAFTALTAIVGGGMAVANFGDDYQRAINKLMLVTDSAEQARNRLSALAQVSLNSYAGIDSTVQLYTRLDLALKQTGGSASEAIQITETLSKTVALAGLTTAEANSALLQISQAFNKGKLDGDEFRTVMETMPPLADSIARQLTKMNGGIAVTRGELLKLAPEGKITGEVMKRAVLDMAEAVDQKFAQLTPTVSMQLQNLQTQAQMYFGSMFKDSGMANALASAIQLIGNNLDKATQLALMFGSAMVVLGTRAVLVTLATQTMTVVKAFQQANGALAVMNALMVKSPIGVFAVALTGLLYLFDELSGNLITNSLFPSFEQDKAIAEDYISRLKEINGQLSTMTYTKLTQENKLLQNAMLQNNIAIKEQQQNLNNLKNTISAKAKELEQAKQVVLEYENGTRTAIDAYGGWGIAIDSHAQAQEKVINLTRELTQLQAEEVNNTRELDKAKEDSIELLKTELAQTEHQITLINQAREAVEGKTQKDIEASAELQAQANIVRQAETNYMALTSKVWGLRSALQAILGVSANLAPAINNVGENSVDKVTQTAFEKAKAELEWKKKYASSDKHSQIEMDVRKKYDKEFGEKQISEQEMGELVKLAQQTYDIEQKQIEARKESRKAESEALKAQKKAEREAQKKADELQKAKDSYDQYLNGLKDEQALLQQGYTNYTQFSQLYKLKYELQQKGLTISEQELQDTKELIMANEREKELAKEINQIEESSLAKQREQFALKWRALQLANVSDTDKQIGREKIMSEMGAIGSPMQGVEEIKQKYEDLYARLAVMRAEDSQNATQYTYAELALKKKQAQEIYARQIENMHAMGGFWSTTATAIQSFEQNATTAFSNILNGTQSVGEAMSGLASTILNDVVNSIVKMGVEWVAQQMAMAIAGQTTDTKAQASATTTGTAIASAYAPAAAMKAMATDGTSAMLGMAAMTAGVALVPALLGRVLGQRRHGGSVRAGGMYQVGEGNAPEIYQSSSGRQYMIAGDNGRVFSNKQSQGMLGGRVVNITQNVTINGNGQLDQKMLAQLKQNTREIVYEVLTDEKREAGGILA